MSFEFLFIYLKGYSSSFSFSKPSDGGYRVAVKRGKNEINTRLLICQFIVYDISIDFQLTGAPYYVYSLIITLDRVNYFFGRSNDIA